MTKNEKGFFLFYDWIERLRELPSDDSIRIILAIGNYFKEGTDPTEHFDGPLKIVVALMYDQIKRGERLSEIRAEAGRKGIFAKANQSKAKQSSTTYNNITDNNITKKEEIHKEEKETTSLKKNPLADRFARFWSVYPKKVGKGAAEKAFIKIHPSEALTEQMIEAVKAQSKSEQWKRDKGQYIPNPATWLNQGRWEDCVGVNMPRQETVIQDEPYPF